MRIKISILLIFVFLISCSSDNKVESMNSNTIDNNQQKLYINLDNTLRQKILEYISTLDIGTDWKDIEQEYKSYFIERSIVGKQNNISKGKIRKIYLKKLDENLVNEKYDEYIFLVFDLDDKLIEKDIVNIKGKK
jgi:hypothetical protein